MFNWKTDEPLDESNTTTSNPPNLSNLSLSASMVPMAAPHNNCLEWNDFEAFG